MNVQEKKNPGLWAKGKQNERIEICKRVLHKNSGSADQTSEVVSLNILYKRFVLKRKPEARTRQMICVLVRIFKISCLHQRNYYMKEQIDMVKRLLNSWYCIKRKRRTYPPCIMWWWGETNIDQNKELILDGNDPLKITIYQFCWC